MNKGAATNTYMEGLCVNMCLHFLGKVPRSEIAGSYGNSTSNFCEEPVFQTTVLHYIPTSSV